ncbi:ureidoglycolate dehydrogenase (NAD(+))-like [Schistocerca serialis cubense]|uniref:ureidoglycolate dehydrogenase (NAD(+))-like n=1 Tax=Schistocerca serialis cubense TaxID=2023355 RepID=UPI00214E426E|nr:ureidoglycolate dehydrogenase (NAD(+))-like [Schistocerca serialis cubense]
MWRLAKHLSRRPTVLLPGWTPQRTMAKKGKGEEFVVTPCEVVRFCEEVLVSAGACQSNAKEAAHVIAAADYFGRSTHGILRLGFYVDELCSGRVNGQARPCLIQETSATANVDGCNAMGAVVGNFCNNLALKKARDCGVGYVCARHANHFGIASYYTRFIADCGMIGVAMSVAAPSVVAAGSKQAMFGTNPLSVAAPGCDGDNFVFDIATSNTSVGRIQEYALQKKKLPTDWALGKKGTPTTDANDALATRKLLPLGGLTTGYKGYGLAAAVDILTSVLAGAQSGPNIPVHGSAGKDCKDPPKHACLGMSFLVLDPDAFGEGFRQRLSVLLSALRCAEPADAAHPVRAPGDFSKKSAEQCDCRGGIAYAKHQRAAMEDIAKRSKIKPMQPNK